MSVGLGFIGAGNHARHHMKEFQRLAGCRLAGVFDIAGESSAWAASEFPGIRAESTLAGLLGGADIDAVVIATPAETHRELVLAALESGLDVLIEKPIAHTSADARAIVEAAESRPDRIVMVGHCERFNPSYLDARRAVDEGKIGVPRFGTASRLSPLRLNDPAWGLGALDTAVHDVDILMWLINDTPVTVAAQGVSVNPSLSIPDQVTYQIRFVGGALAQGHVGWLPFSGGYPMCGNAHPRLLLAGTNGMLTVDLWQRPAAVHTYSTGEYFWPDSVLVGYGDYQTEVTAQDAAFLRAVTERLPSPSSAKAACHAVCVAHAAHKSMMDHDGSPISVEEV